MATGFSENETRLGRLVARAMDRGVTHETLGMTGQRTVGPLAQMVVVNGRPVYAVNNENGIVLGATFKEAVATLDRLIAESDTWEETRARCS